MLRWLRWMIALALLSIPIMATASIGGLLERQGLTTTGEDLTVSDDLTVGDDMTITDDSTFGDDVEINGNITLENDEILDNATDAVVSITANDDAAELLDVQVYSSNTSTANNDYFRTSFWIEDDGSVKTELAAINYICTDITSNTVDAKVDHYLQKADTLTKVLTLTSTSLDPGADDTSDLGSSGLEWKDLYVDGTAYIDTLEVGTMSVGTTVDTDITLESGEIVSNASDGVVEIIADDDAVELMDVARYSSNTSTSNNDYIRDSYWIEDSGSVKTEFAAINQICTDVTSNTVDAKTDFYLMKADTLTKVMTLNATSLTAGADNTSDLGASDLEWKDLYIDGTANIDSLVADTADVDGGTIDGAAVGANSASTGAFTTIEASSTITSTGNVLPAADNGADLGASDKEWKDLYIDGSIYADDVQPDCLVLGLVVKYPSASSVDLTSPTVTFSAANKFRVVLSSDENQTGIYPTGGAINQVLVIESYGTGSNTMRFDDGTSMTIGGNITLTEAQADVLTLLCTSADGDEWRRLSNADN